MSIRGAVDEDLPAIIMLADTMYHESRYAAIMPINLDKLANLFRSLIAGQDGVILVAEQNGEVIGAVPAWITTSPFSDALIFGEYGVYVLHAHRGDGTGRALVNAWREWGHNAGAVEGLAAITTGIHTEQTAKLYEHCGGKLLGPVFAF